jgi:methylated-DNA-[protein]-cysteine S-methyltransferase
MEESGRMWTVIDSPVGELRLVAAGGALTAVDFLGDLPAGPGESRSAVLRACRPDGARPEDRDDDDPLLREAADQLAAYFLGQLHVFDLPVAPAGSAFQRQVWDELRRIPYGEVRSYGAIAQQLGRSGLAARAVGAANGRNPVPIVIPCHRVVGANGRLTGYGGGMARKERLLRLEQQVLF